MESINPYPYTFFISYRRVDTGPIALLLKNEIEKRLQFVRVFVDVERVRIGDHFPDRLRTLIQSAQATIVLVGKHWMPRQDEETAISPAKDWVVEEIEFSRIAPITVPPDSSRAGKPRVVLPLFVDCDQSFDQFRVPDSIAFVTELDAKRIDYAGWPAAIGPLLENIAVQLDLKKRPDADEYPTPDPGKARTQPVPYDQLTEILRYDDYEGWYLDNYGNADVTYLVKTFRFPHFNQAADFMAMVANHCRVLDHHPEWRNVFNHVTVSLTTWDAQRRVTIYDLNLALYMNMAARAVRRQHGSGSAT